MLVLGVLPVLALKPTPTVVEIHGGLFQDFAPSVFHLPHLIFLSDLNTGATGDRFVADQIIPFAALANGESRFIIPQSHGSCPNQCLACQSVFGSKSPH
jgi:RNA 3'-terminal phosphate cyclase